MQPKKSETLVIVGLDLDHSRVAFVIDENRLKKEGPLTFVFCIAQQNITITLLTETSWTVSGFLVPYI